MPNATPLVSIILPFQRKDELFEVALSSIIEQSYSNLEVLLLDNRPFDNKGDLFIADQRISVIDCRAMKTLSAVLNQGILLSNGKYIARMDSDDISLSSRIRKQVDYLEKNRQIGILGTSIEVIDLEGHHIEFRLQPTKHEQIISRLHSNNPFFHPTVMMRAETLRKFNFRYNPRYVRAQDYELWTRMLMSVEGANLDESLVQYRLHEKQAGSEIKYQSVFYFRMSQAKFTLKNMLLRREPWNTKIIIFPFVSSILLSKCI